VITLRRDGQALTRPGRKRIALAVLALAMVPALSGCWQGFGASTTMQNSMNSGNGTQVTVGELRVENATIVRGDDGTSSLIMSIFNRGPEADELVGVALNGEPIDITKLSTTAIEPGSFHTYGYGAEGQAPDGYLLTSNLNVEPGSYATVTLAFAKSGATEFESIVVPAVGYYEGLVPPPAN